MFEIIMFLGLTFLFMLILGLVGWIGEIAINRVNQKPRVKHYKQSNNKVA